jgi:hypothetical protein
MHLSQLAMNKGTIGGAEIIMWDFVANCNMEECVIFKLCGYTKNPKKKCGLERRYISGVIRPFFDLARKISRKKVTPDPFMMQWIGLHVLPLYSQLAKLCKEEAALSDVYKDGRKNKTIHPIYAEIRSVIFAIRKEWSGGGLLQIAQAHGYLSEIELEQGGAGKRSGRPAKKKKEKVPGRFDNW